MIGPAEFKRRMADSFSKKAEAYDARAGLQFEVAAMLRGRFEKYIRPGDRLLDVGCGTGLVSLPLSAEGLDVHAVDMARGMVAMIRRKRIEGGGIHPAVGDGEFLPYAPGRFDLVVSSLTYHWIWNLSEAFCEAYRVLKEGGIFSVAVSGRGSLSELRDAYTAALGNDGERLPPLVTFPRADDISAAIAAAGFGEVAVESVDIVRSYSDFWELLRAMKAIGAGNPYRSPVNSLRSKSPLEAVRNQYHARYADGRGIRATYEVLFCSGVKPAGNDSRGSTR